MSLFDWAPIGEHSECAEHICAVEYFHLNVIHDLNGFRWEVRGARDRRLMLYSVGWLELRPAALDLLGAGERMTRP